MGIYSLKPRFQRWLRGAETWLVARGVHPDLLTLAALALSLAGGVVLVIAQDIASAFLCLLPLVALMRTALNALDGMVARSSGLAQPWGEVLNEFCDRLADIALFGGLAFAPYIDPHLGTATLASVLLSSYVGILSKTAGGQRQYRGIMAKPDRMVALSVTAVVAFVFDDLHVFNYFLGIVLIGTIITTLQRLVRTYGDLRQ